MNQDYFFHKSPDKRGQQAEQEEEDREDDPEPEVFQDQLPAPRVFREVVVAHRSAGHNPTEMREQAVLAVGQEAIKPASLLELFNFVLGGASSVDSIELLVVLQVGLADFKHALHIEQ